jgi:hypothetical protein
MAEEDLKFPQSKIRFSKEEIEQTVYQDTNDYFKWRGVRDSDKTRMSQLYHKPNHKKVLILSFSVRQTNNITNQTIKKYWFYHFQSDKPIISRTKP